MPLLLIALLAAANPQGPERWEANIAKFEEADRAEPAPRGAVLFLGSSSIVGWNTTKWFPELVTVNRGFGGSRIGDSVHYFDRVAVPYRPRIIVFYAGDNDIAGKMSPEAVAADFAALVERLHAGLPGTRLLYVAIKPSPSRWALWPQAKDANDRIRAMCEADDSLAFLDIAPPMFGADGTPRRELFRDDMLHLNEAGYALWSEMTRAALEPWLRHPPPAQRRPGKRPSRARMDN